MKIFFTAIVFLPCLVLAWQTEIKGISSQIGFVIGRTDGSRTAYATDGAAFAGVLENGAQSRRPVYKFGLPAKLPRKTITAACLRLAYINTHTDGNGGDVVLESILDEDNPQTVDTDDFDEPALATLSGTTQVSVMSGDDTTTPNFTFLDVDVTEFVQSALRAKRNVVTFRLRNTDTTKNGGRYFGTPRYSRYEPSLVIRIGNEYTTYVLSPESDGYISDYREGTPDWDNFYTGDTTLQIGDGGDDATKRAVLKMALPVIPDSEKVINVRLNFMLQQFTNTPWTNAEAVCCWTESQTVSLEDSEPSGDYIVVPDVMCPSMVRSTPISAGSKELASFFEKGRKAGKIFVTFLVRMTDGDWSDWDRTPDEYIIGASTHPNAIYRPYLVVSTLPKRLFGATFLVK